MKRFLSLTLAVILAALLASCAYTEGFIGSMMTEKRVNGSLELTFGSFKGKKVYALRCGEDEVIEYSASVGTGELTVSFDVKKETFDSFIVKEGENISGQTNPSQKATVYITIYASDTCRNGKLVFKTKKPADS